MKTFKQKLQEWNDVDAGSVEDSSIGVHNIQDSEVLSRVNAFVGALADREYINPNAAINNLQQNLHRIGLDFKEQLRKDPKNTFNTMRQDVAVNFKTTKNMSQYKEDMKRIDRLEDVFGVRLSIFNNDINKALGKELKEK